MSFPFEESVLSTDPESLRDLSDEQRLGAVTELVRECAKLYLDAASEQNSPAAQDAAIRSLGALAGLFPDRNDPVHALLLGMTGAIYNARFGRREHILLKSNMDLPGMKRGFGHAYVAAFAISATLLLTEWGYTQRKALKTIASALASQGYSTRSDDHGEPKLITEGAIRNWVEKPDQFQAQRLMADRMTLLHTQNIINRDIGTADDVAAYFAEASKKVCADSAFL